jgi:hypothetical protein
MNKSEIVITDMEAVKQGEASPSFRNDAEKHTFQEKMFIDINETNTLTQSKLLGDETIKLDLSTQKHNKDNLFDSAININVNNSSQLMNTQQSIQTDLASLYKTFNYSILLLGGKPDGVGRKLELESKSWKEIKSINVDRTDFSAIMYKEKKILLIGGRINEAIVDTIDLLNLDEMAIKRLDVKLKSNRANFGSVYFNNRLFVAGGNSGKETLNTLNSFDYFDKKTKNWNELQKMIYRRKEFCLMVGPDNHMYALGGTDEKE